jgi:hypothetical protein
VKIKWHYNGDSPDACGAVGCHEELNGLYYTSIKVGKAKCWINACEKCKRKAGELND